MTTQQQQIGAYTLELIDDTNFWYGSGQRKNYTYTGIMFGDRQPRRSWVVTLNEWVMTDGTKPVTVAYTAPGSHGIMAILSGSDYDTLWSQVRIDTNSQWDRQNRITTGIGNMLAIPGVEVSQTPVSLSITAPTGYVIMILQSSNNSGLDISLRQLVEIE